MSQIMKQACQCVQGCWLSQIAARTTSTIIATSSLKACFCRCCWLCVKREKEKYVLLLVSFIPEKKKIEEFA
ncbi:hypothetical protein MtrunA17_Chr3g0133781 [Medicago truncatula]|nr:hypothetical protein MtrunA17_Chr3g0133781 [Medicago truncatula]